MIKSLEEKLPETNNLAENNLPDETSKQDDSEIIAPRKSIIELSQEEEALKNRLDALKKENFMLQASIKAWQTTLKKKLAEFNDADSKLDDIHNEIWTEREKFCAKVDEFTSTYGLLSNWWATQLKFVSDLEKLERKSSEDIKLRKEIEELEKEVEEIKKEIKALQTGQQVVEVEVHATADGDSFPVSRKTSMTDASTERLEAKKVRLSDAEEKIEICNDRQPTKDDLYSMVDLNKLKMVNRNRARHRKSQFFGKVKKLLTM